LPAGVAPDDVNLLADRSLPRSWTRRWASLGDRQLLFDDATGWISAAQLEERTRQVAGRLAGAGLSGGDRLLLSAHSSSQLVIAYIAALRLGLVVVPVNTAYRQREVAHVVTDAKPAAALVDDNERAGWVSATSGEEPVVIFGPDVDLPPSPAPPLDLAMAEDPALMVYTSGTTGVPKGAPLTHGNLLASAEGVRLAWRWNEDDRLILALPLFHMHGLGVGVNGTLTAGGSVVLRKSFTPDDVLDAAAVHRGTLLFGVPTMYTRLAASDRVDELGRLRLCVSGSAPLPADLFAQIAERSGQAILERYGMTETGMNLSNPYDGERRPGTVGFPLPGVSARLDTGTDEIMLQGPNVFGGYWNRPDANAESFEEGWFHSGDVGALDDDGYFRIVGRRKELIISGGYNVYPREVEDVLRGHPSVIDAAVVGRPHAEWGEQVVAFVEGSGRADELLAYASERLAPYKRPKQIHLVNQLPRNALGKVTKDALKEQEPKEAR
jgi:malonyl-CoA/methylmalonyl-CoA synthetase